MPCQKLGISFYHFLGDRLGLGVAGQPIPPLSALGTTAN
jgi:transposase